MSFYGTTQAAKISASTASNIKGIGSVAGKISKGLNDTAKTMYKAKLYEDKEKASASKKTNQVAALKKLHGNDILKDWSDDEISGLIGGTALKDAVKRQDEAATKKNLIAAYRIQHPKFSDKLDDNQLFEYINFAGNEVNNPKTGKVIDIHTDPKGGRYASIQNTDGSISQQYLGEVKTDWNTPKKKGKGKDEGYDPKALSNDLMNKAKIKKDLRLNPISDDEL